MINLSAGVEPITYVAGDTPALVFDFVHSDGSEIPITGWVITFQILTCSGSVIATLTNGSGISVSGNTATVSLSSTITNNAALDGGSYSLKAQNAGQIRTYVRGKFRKQQ